MMSGAAVIKSAAERGCLRGGLGAGDFPHCTVPDASKHMAKCPDAPLMGHLPQHSLYPFGCADRGDVLPQHKGKAGKVFSIFVACGGAELCLLPSGGAVCRRSSGSGNADLFGDRPVCGSLWSGKNQHISCLSLDL